MYYKKIKYDDDRIVRFECAQCGGVKEWNQFLGVTSKFEMKCRHCGRFHWGVWII